ncbi:MAG TPA: hypothetical protein VL574_09750 [Stellaceae bacterium]|nr:hypothetical protein [Stellaceae bacterium]
MVIHSGEHSDPYEWDQAEEEELEAETAEALSPVFSLAAPRTKTLIWLILLLPWFGQTFSYIRDVLPAWAFAKAFPVLSLPLAFVLMRHQRMVMSRQVLLSFGWLVLMPTFAAIFYFQQGFFTGITAQVKLLPLLSFFSFLGLLLLLKPTLKEIAYGYLAIGFATLALLVFFWLAIPDSWYAVNYVPNTNPLFSVDDRGHRIRMPWYFPAVALFFCYRRFIRYREWRYLLGVLGAFAVAVFIVRTRGWVIGILGVLAINSFMWARPLVKVALLVALPVAAIGIFSVGYLATTFNFGTDTGFDTRWITIQKATEFLGWSPMRWLFGVGTISPTSSDSLMAYFDHFFFLADITWLGIVFEYGIIGALLFLAFELRGMLLYRRISRQIDDDFLGALCDFILYTLIISNVYPMTLVPGETAIIMAVFAYILHAGLSDHAEPVRASP